MSSTGLKIGSALLCIVAIPAISGCANCRAGTRVTTVSSKCVGCKKGCFGCKDTTVAFAPRTEFKLTGADLPPNAKTGECYAKVFVPPEFKTVTERICVREESERLEIIPAQYEWVEEQVLVKEASTELVEVPAQYETRETLVQTSPGHTTWVKQSQARCVADTPGPPPQDIFCLVSAPPTTMSIQTECLAKPATVEQRTIPAEYQAVRKQKCVQPATTRRIPIPAEFRDIERTVMVSPGRMEWQLVDCDIQATTERYGIETEFRQVRDVNPEFDRDLDVDVDVDLDEPDLDEPD